MKKLAAVFSIALGLVIPTGPTQINLVADFPQSWDSPGLIFKVYSTTNISLPVSSWPLLASAPASNVLSFSTVTFPITVIPKEHFFVMTASNFWGETDFSNVTNTPNVLGNMNNVRVRR